MKFSFIIISALFLSACSKDPGDLNPVIKTITANDSIMVLVGNTNVPADDFSNAEVRVIVKNLYEINTTQKTITFTIDQPAKFMEGGGQRYVSTGIVNDTIKAHIKVNKPGLVKVAAQVGTVIKEVFLNFSQAFPDQILVEPSAFNLSSTSTAPVSIKATLSRILGTVSEGLVVNFYDSTAGNYPIGVFANTKKSNVGGEATTDFYILEKSFKGFVYIKAYVDTDKGRVIGTSKILVQ